MAYQILDKDNNLIETVETKEQLDTLFEKAINLEVDYVLLWSDEGLLDALQASGSLDSGIEHRFVKHAEEE